MVKQSTLLVFAVYLTFLIFIMYYLVLCSSV